MDEETLKKPLFACTLGEFVKALTDQLGLMVGDVNETTPTKRNLVYGLTGLSSLLGCSISTAARIKKSGVLNPAIHQTGKIIAIDADLALELLKLKAKRYKF